MIFSGGGMSRFSFCKVFLLQSHVGSARADVVASRRVSGAQESDAMVLKDLARQL
jgi:hypothetical protein